MTRPAWTRGKAVQDGRLAYVSPSQIVAADHDSFGGCLRRWWYRRVEGRPEPMNAAAEVGKQGHSEIEEYLTTGRMTLGQHALSAKRYLPAPSPSLQIECSIDDGTILLAGVPVVGFVDYLNTSGQVLLDHGATQDPDRSAEVVDWKFTGRRDFPTAQEVASALPMALYGEWAARKLDLEWVRLSHVYIGTRRREASKRSLLVPREEFAPKLERAERVVRRLQQAAQCKSAGEVEANTSACTAYGGCPHRAYCQAGEQKTLADLFGPLGAARILNPEPPDMSLLNIPALAALKQPDPIADARAALIAEEQAARVDPAVKAAVQSIIASGYGQPTLTGAAAQAWGAAIGIGVTQGAGLVGSGDLAAATFSDPADLIKAAQELSGLPPKAAAPAPAQGPAAAKSHALVTGLLPPDAPASDPVKAAAALEPKAAPPAPIAAPAPNTEIETGRVSAAAPPIASEESGELKLSKKARAEFERMQARIFELEGQVSAYAVRQTSADPVPVAAPTTQGIGLFVDCTPPPGAVDLSSWVYGLAGQLAKQYGAADIRCAPDQSPLSFGKWKGALAAACREDAIADGFYHLDARGSELLEVAVEALRSRVRFVCRGIR